MGQVAPAANQPNEKRGDVEPSIPEIQALIADRWLAGVSVIGWI